MSSKTPLNSIVSRIERYIIRTLIALMSFLLVLATVELGFTIYRSVIFNGIDNIFIDLDNLMNVFGVFLMVLIGIELLDTIKVYFKKHIIHVEVVMLVAIIAVARKVIVMDFDKYSGLETIGIASIVIALAGGYYLIKRTGCEFWPAEKEETEDIEVQEVYSGNQQGLIERTKTIKTQSQEAPKETIDQNKDVEEGETPSDKGKEVEPSEHKKKP